MPCANKWVMTRKWDPTLGQFRDAGKFGGNDQPAAEGGMSALSNDQQGGTWTFFGHWDDSDEIVIEYTLVGEHNDDRDDDGEWAGGLWCDSASGATVEEARATVIAQYMSEMS